MGFDGQRDSKDAVDEALEEIRSIRGMTDAPSRAQAGDVRLMHAA